MTTQEQPATGQKWCVVVDHGDGRKLTAYGYHTDAEGYAGIATWRKRYPQAADVRLVKEEEVTRR